jgi:hypothetical protein
MEAIMEKLDSMKNRDDEDVTKPEAEREPEPEEERPLPPIPNTSHQTTEVPKTLDTIMQKLDFIEKGENAIAEFLLNNIAPLKPHPPPSEEPKSFPQAPHPPTGPRPPPGPPPAAVAHVHHAPKIEIAEEANLRQSELKPRPPVSESPLNSQISKLQMTYLDSVDIDKKIVKVIIDHMKCIEHFDLSGPEKKTIVLNSIETILIDHSIKDYTFILDLSSQLIDTFIAFDKDKIHIIEKASSLSCFPCNNKL